MFENFFSYFPILFTLVIIILLFSKAWSKRDFIKSIINNDKLLEIKGLNLKKSDKELLKKQIAQIKIDYQKNKALARPISEINFFPIIINLLIAGFNLKMFLTNFSTEIEIIYSFWVSFFLLLLNLPLFIYKENNKDIGVSILLFLVLSLFCFPVLFLCQSLDVIILMIGWLFNFLHLLFYSKSHHINSLKGKTVLFVLFWVFILGISIFIDVKFNLPEKYNYGFLINVLYFMLNAYFVYISQKYDRIDTG